MQDINANLSPSQVTALAALLAGRSVRAAAKAAGVDPATIHRWLNESDFRAAQQAGRRQLAQQALAQLQGITADAIGVVRELMTDTSKPATVRLRAAQIVIEGTAKWLELEDFDARLRALEEHHAEKR